MLVRPCNFRFPFVILVCCIYWILGLLVGYGVNWFEKPSNDDFASHNNFHEFE